MKLPQAAQGEEAELVKFRLLEGKPNAATDTVIGCFPHRRSLFAGISLQYKWTERPGEDWEPYQVGTLMNNESGVSFALRILRLLPEASQTTRKKEAASISFPEATSAKKSSLSRLAKIGYQGGATYLSGGQIKFESGGDKLRFHWSDQTRDVIEKDILAVAGMRNIAFELPCRYDVRLRQVSRAYQIKVYNFWGEWVRLPLQCSPKIADVKSPSDKLVEIFDKTAAATRSYAAQAGKRSPPEFAYKTTAHHSGKVRFSSVGLEFHVPDIASSDDYVPSDEEETDNEGITRRLPGAIRSSYQGWADHWEEIRTSVAPDGWVPRTITLLQLPIKHQENSLIWWHANLKHAKMYERTSGLPWELQFAYCKAAGLVRLIIISEDLHGKEGEALETCKATWKRKLKGRVGSQVRKTSFSPLLPYGSRAYSRIADPEAWVVNWAQALTPAGWRQQLDNTACHPSFVASLLVARAA